MRLSMFVMLAALGLMLRVAAPVHAAPWANPGFETAGIPFVDPVPNWVVPPVTPPGDPYTPELASTLLYGPAYSEVTSAHAGAWMPKEGTRFLQMVALNPSNVPQRSGSAVRTENAGALVNGAIISGWFGLDLNTNTAGSVQVWAENMATFTPVKIADWDGKVVETVPPPPHSVPAPDGTWMYWSAQVGSTPGLVAGDYKLWYVVADGDASNALPVYGFFDATQVRDTPEPATMGLLGFGLALGAVRRRRAARKR